MKGFICGLILGIFSVVYGKGASIDAGCICLAIGVCTDLIINKEKK